MLFRLSETTRYRLGQGAMIIELSLWTNNFYLEHFFRKVFQQGFASNAMFFPALAVEMYRTTSALSTRVWQ